jgi:Apea-like HEPN
MTPDGKIDVSCSWSATSAVGFHEGWEDLLQKETAPLLISAAGKALEPIRDPAVKRPLATRLTDAVGWFGDAVMEESPAAQIVKAVTALEALVMTGEHEEIAAEVSARAAALCFDPERDATFEVVNEEMKNAYDMRSRLAHGSLSPFDPEVTQYAPECLFWAERAIGGALVLFESHGLLDRDLTRKRLKEGMTRLIEAAKQLSAEKSKASEHAQDGGSGGQECCLPVQTAARALRREDSLTKRNCLRRPTSLKPRREYRDLSGFILFLRPAHNFDELILGQGLLQRGCLVPRRAHPDIVFFRRCQNDGHGFPAASACRRGHRNVELVMSGWPLPPDVVGHSSRSSVGIAGRLSAAECAGVPRIRLWSHWY